MFVMKANDESWNFDIKKMLLLRECIKGFPPKNNVIFVVIWLFVSCLSDFYGILYLRIIPSVANVA